MPEKQCKECQHFLQHYTLGKRKLYRIHCGHCTLGRAKRKRPDTIACEYFAPGSPPEDAFPSKEYLSKELLQYLLSLELMPEIDSAE